MRGTKTMGLRVTFQTILSVTFSFYVDFTLLFVYFFFSNKHMPALKVGKKTQVSDLGLASLSVLLDEKFKCLILKYLSI